MLTKPVDESRDSDKAAQKSKQTLAQRIYDTLKEDIRYFRLIPGDRFSESETSLRLGVSRTPLREALQRLQNEGFIGVDPKSGWYVTPIDFDYLGELYDFRILIEKESIVRLCQLEGERRPLSELCQFWLVPEDQQIKDGHIVSQHDEKFHSVLVEATGNREMLKVHKQITERIRIVRQLDFTKPVRIEATYREHASILRAILDRDITTAQKLLRQHVQASEAEVKGITLHALMAARSRIVK